MLLMKHTFYFLLLLLCPGFIWAQYTETFATANKGILSGTCSNNDPTSCASVDFTGVDWTIGGDLSGIDVEGFSTLSGRLQANDIDEAACWISPTLDISSTANASITVTFTIPAGSNWDSGSAVGSIDYANVNYSIDGGSYITLPNVNGCAASPYTISGNECSGLSGPMTFMPTISGLSGNTLDIQVCLDTNASSEYGHIEEISVPEANVMILPVELFSFKAEKGEKGILLKWATASELNNEKFEIEHSTNGRAFEKIGEIKGKETTLQVSDYSFQHQSPISGGNYYRLKQIDLDGQFEYSKVVSLNFKGEETEVGRFYPIPSKTGIVNLDLNSLIDGQISVSIFDMSGKMMGRQEIKVQNGFNNLNFDYSTLNNGIYLVKIDQRGNQTYRKLLIER